MVHMQRNVTLMILQTNVSQHLLSLFPRNQPKSIQDTKKKKSNIRTRNRNKCNVCTDSSKYWLQVHACIKGAMSATLPQVVKKIMANNFLKWTCKK